MDFKILLQKITPALKKIARRHVLCGFYDAEDLYQEMCLYLWQHYGQGLPIGKNEAYVIKGCEFHLQNFLRKGRPKAALSSLDALINTTGLTLADVLEDKRGNEGTNIETKVTIDDLKKRGLTKREQHVLSSLLKGYTVREIAKEMDISHVMVLKYKKKIIKKWHRKGPAF